MKTQSMNQLILIRVGLVLAVILALSSLAWAGQAEEIVIEQIVSDEAYAGPMLLSASPADTTCIYWEDFQQGTGGWIAKDALAVTDTFWHRVIYNDGGGPKGMMWCGTEDTTWSYPSGYGNDWNQRLTKSFTLPSGTVTADYRLQYDTEPGYDSLYLEVSNDDGETYDVLETWDGDSGGFLSLSTSLNAYAGQSVILRFRFMSDVAISDEDGRLDTNGAARLDWIQVTGQPLDDFETSDNGWIGSPAPPYPDLYRLEETPACEATASPGWPTTRPPASFRMSPPIWRDSNSQSNHL
jgi:hypothetical protein